MIHATSEGYTGALYWEGFQAGSLDKLRNATHLASIKDQGPYGAGYRDGQEAYDNLAQFTMSK